MGWPKASGDRDPVGFSYTEDTMHTVHAPKSDRNTMTITIDPSKVARGHQPHRSGSGKHGDRRSKRLKTRRAQFCAATKE